MMDGQRARKVAVRIKSLLCSLLMLLLAGGTAKAAPKADQLMNEFQKTKSSMSDDDVKQRKILGALFDINHKMKKMVTERSELDQEKMVVEGSVKELAVKIKDLEAKTKIQRSLLRTRLAAIYKLGGQGVARMLFSSTSSAELERNLKILGIVAQRDVSLIKDYSQSRKELEARKQKLTLRWAYLKKVQSKIRAKEQKLADENAVKNKILQNIRTSRNFAMIKLRQLRKKSRQIASEEESGVLDLLFQPSFFEQKGQLPMPVQGKLAQGYGLIKDEVHRVVLSHKGHFYLAPLGSPVKAIFQGKVAFAGTVPGFGQTLILDHGDHYYSVYSHNKTLQVHEGDEVKQSQTLALSGSAGTQMGDGLYFEIRHFSEPSDPNAWMKGNTL
jgi:septal ring factor EnvC (AmiA/AmiB activator)